MLEAYARELAESGRDEEAIAEYFHALRWSPDATPFRAFILYEMAGSEVKELRFAQAASGLREALQICPQTRDYHALLAQALRQQGHTQEADEQMRLEADVRQQLWMAK
jgi:tetratricopeptide (TPR) repeat protein